MKDKKEYQEMETRTQKDYTYDPRDLNALSDLILAKIHLAKYDEALKLCEEFLEKEPRLEPFIMNRMGCVYYLMGNCEKATATLMEVLDSKYSCNVEKNLAFIRANCQEKKCSKDFPFKEDEDESPNDRIRRIIRSNTGITGVPDEVMITEFGFPLDIDADDEDD